MRPDRELLNMANGAAARLKKCRGKAKRDIRRRLQEQSRQYVTACELSRGPDPQRASYWEGRAEIAESRLGDMVHEANAALGPKAAKEKQTQ